MSVNFAYKYLFHSVGIFNVLKILGHGAAGCNSPNQVTLLIFITLKSPSLSARFESANLGSFSQHDNH
jgi:hypothetical protein